MDLLEYQGKQILARHGIPVPRGKAASTVDEAVAVRVEDVEDLGAPEPRPPWDPGVVTGGADLVFDIDPIDPGRQIGRRPRERYLHAVAATRPRWTAPDLADAATAIPAARARD